MLIQKAFQYELRTDGATRRAFTRMAGAKRFVWNKALELQKERYALGLKHLTAFELNNLLPSWKKEYPWMREAHSQVLQQVLKDLDRAYKNFFAGRAERPQRKKKGKSRDSFRYPQGFKIEEENNRIYLPKIGWVRYRNSRAVRGDAKNVTVSRSQEKWFISIQTEYEFEPLLESSSVVGIDMGIARFATLSDGTFVAPLNSFKKHEIRLRRYQRRMSRKVKFSQNWKKAKNRVSKIHLHLANARKDFLHKTSTLIGKNHAVVVVEDLNVKNMSGSASGTLARPGKNVRQKSGLNKAILDQAWAEFRRQLGYKLSWRGGRLLAVPPQYTSQRCPRCGHTGRENRPSQSEFKCVKCGYTNNADVVGAINIKAAGHAVIEREALVHACGEAVEVRPSMKQEPTENAADADMVGIPSV
jgi:putative transposase